MQQARLDQLFAAARATPVPTDLAARVRARVFAAQPLRPRSRWLRAALLLALGGALAAAAMRLWTVRIDPRAGTIDGGTLRDRQKAPDGSETYQIELPDGRRVDVRISPAPAERRVEVELPPTATPAPGDTRPGR